MFKATWEKTSATHELPHGMVEKMLGLAYPNKKLISHELIAGGCANLNIKFLLEDAKQPLILRIYLRDNEAALREQKLAELLKATVPVPLTHYIGEFEKYHFAITEFMPGLTLRDLLLGDAPYNLGEVMYEVGVILAKITKHEFDKSGFFDKNLNITDKLTDCFALTFAKECLHNPNVCSMLDIATISEITVYFSKYTNLLSNTHEKSLVHGDFDPANILVEQQNGKWKVSAVLDWEFAFSNSVLHDVASMLRYAHKMPPEFQDAFLKGLTDSGLMLPENWYIIVTLLNLLSLLDCLKRSDTKNRPSQSKDILELIEHILLELRNA